MKKKLKRLPDAELEIMKVIWTNECPISTSQIKDILDKERIWNVSALQTLLNRLIEKEFLDSYKEGKNRYYTPLITEDHYLACENKSFLEKVNGSSITKLIASLYNSNSITKEDLKELSEFISEKTKEGKL